MRRVIHSKLGTTVIEIETRRTRRRLVLDAVGEVLFELAVSVLFTVSFFVVLGVLASH
jgi:hypothetical protein